MKATYGLVFVVVASVTANAQQLHQVIWDTLDTDLHPTVRYAGFSDDGGAVVALRTSHGTDLVKTAADGTLVWRKDIGLPSNAYGQIFSNGMGGHLHLFNDSSYWEPLDLDTVMATLSLRMTSLNSTGEPLWSHRILSSITSMAWMPTAPTYDAVQSGTGDLFVIGSFSSSSDTQVMVLRIGLDGAVIWARRVPVMDSPLNNTSYILVPDGTGGVYLSYNTFMGSVTKVARLSAVGDLVWAKDIWLENNIFDVQAQGGALMSNGDLCIIGNAMVGADSKGFHFVLTPAGAWQRADLYGETWMGPAIGQVGDTLLMMMGSSVTRMSPTFDFLDLAGAVGATGMNATHALAATKVKYESGIVHVIGNLNSTDLTFGYTTYRPADWSFLFDPTSGCAIASYPLGVSHDQVPESLLADEVLTGTSEPIPTTVQTMSITAVDRPLWTFTDACTVISEAPDGVSEAEHVSAIVLANNPASNGSPVMVTCRVPAVLDLYDARGARVIVGVRATADTPMAIDVSGLAPGIYPLLARQLNGQLVATRKVIVQ